MTFKVLEIRDRGTCIPAMAIRMWAENNVQEHYIHYRCGHPEDGSSIVLMDLDSCRATNDPHGQHGWEVLGFGPRTMPVAHDWIYEHFDELKDGDVVDVEFILGEVKIAKVPERLVEGLHE